MTTWGIIGGYYLAAALAGPAVGLLRPLLNHRMGTFLVGWIAGTIVYGAVGFTMDAQHDAPWWLAAGPGLAMGGLALVLQDQDRGQTETRPRFIIIAIVLGAVLALLMLLAGWW